MLTTLIETIENIDPYLAVAVVSVIPMIELRGGVLLGAALGLGWLETIIVCVAANMIPIPIVILFGRRVIALLERKDFSKDFIASYKAKIMSKSGQIQKYGTLGLILFVGIPIPGTGIWTGSVLALLMDLRMRRAVPAMFVGAVIAALIMSVGAAGISSVV